MRMMMRGEGERKGGRAATRPFVTSKGRAYYMLWKCPHTHGKNGPNADRESILKTRLINGALILHDTVHHMSGVIS